jgi:hypothetical protein
MPYPVIIQDNVEVVSCGNECSSAGNATFTIERSSDAMKVAREVAKKTP